MKAIHYVLAFAFTATCLADKPTSAAPVEAVKASKATPAAAGKTIVADVEGIVCAFCVQGIQKIFQKKGKADEVVISLELKKVFVTEKKGQSLADDEFRETIRQAGFKTTALTRTPLTIAEARTRLTNKQSLVVAATKETKPMQTASR